jgi:hypothetical protein
MGEMPSEKVEISYELNFYFILAPNYFVDNCLPRKINPGPSLRMRY